MPPTGEYSEVGEFSANMTQSSVEVFYDADMTSSNFLNSQSNTTVATETLRSLDLQPSLPAGLKAMVIIMGLIINIAGGFGSILIILVISTSKLLRRTYNLCVASLALNSLVQCLLINMTQLAGISLGKFPLGSFCLFYNMMWSHMHFVSICHVTIISVVRYLLVVHQSLTFTQNKSLFISLLVVVQIITFLLIDVYKIGRTSSIDPTTGLCWITPFEPLSTYLFTANLIISILAVLWSYVGIYRHVLTQKKMIRTITSASTITLRNNLKKNMHHMKIVQCMVLVLVTTAVCMILPLASLLYIYMRKYVQFLHVLTPILLWTFSTANTIIYGLNDSTFRQAYRRMLCRNNQVGMSISFITGTSNSNQIRMTAVTHTNTN